MHTSQAGAGRARLIPPHPRNSSRARAGALAIGTCAVVFRFQQIIESSPQAGTEHAQFNGHLSRDCLRAFAGAHAAHPRAPTPRIAEMQFTRGTQSDSYRNCQLNCQGTLSDLEMTLQRTLKRVRFTRWKFLRASVRTFDFYKLAIASPVRSEKFPAKTNVFDAEKTKRFASGLHRKLLTKELKLINLVRCTA